MLSLELLKVSIDLRLFPAGQMMSAVKSGHVAYSRFARMAEMEEEHHEQEKLKKKISVERSGGGL